MKTIWLIRHGESVSNAGMQTTHPAESAQTLLGHRQAAAVAQVFSGPPDLIIASHYLRSQQAAAPTRARFPHVPVEEWPVHEFTYLAPERYAGTTYQERRPHADAYWQRCDPFHCEGEGAETFHALIGRARSCLARIEERREQFIAVFGHGLFIRAALWWLLAQPQEIDTDEMQRFHAFIRGVRMPNGAIVPLRCSVDDGFWIGQTQTAHLADVAREGFDE